ncbi:hypothetical protein BHE74_00034424 [Ensete ventricosum]|nr:hypothetical protein GW17_00024392 [Ensete ventricosum]RWW58684.1 hypothetical protein BHE74_00034424 [Ensete ventricosum]RZS13321.1 hypothetical protein BHM03_00044888 [Ensete ventricosum]
MGNACVGPSLLKNGFFQSVSATLWRSRLNKEALPAANNEAAGEGTSDAPAPAPAPAKPAVDAPQPVKIQNEQTGPPRLPEVEGKQASDVPSSDQPKKPTHVKRLSSVAGLQEEFILKHKTDSLKDVYSLGRKLGQGQFGTTYLCVEKATGKENACKSILKRKLVTEEDVQDVRREIQIMHHLSGHPSVISIKGAYEDAVAVHVVMELCAGGELFDRIIQKGHFTERKAAELARVIVGVVEACHSMGVMHRDLKPENFLFVNQMEDSPLKTIDFGLSIFFRPGHPWVQIDGVAPDMPLDSAVLSRLKQFSAMNKLKKMAIRVIAEHLSEDEIAGLKEMFKMIDTDNSGQITFEELKAGLERVGANLQESEIYALMQAVGIRKI